MGMTFANSGKMRYNGRYKGGRDHESGNDYEAHEREKQIYGQPSEVRGVSKGSVCLGGLPSVHQQEPVGKRGQEKPKLRR